MNRTHAVRTALAILLIYLLFVSWLPERIYYSIFQSAILIFTAILLVHAPRPLKRLIPWPIGLMLLFSAWGVVQLATGRTVYAWPAKVAVLDWLVFACVGWLSYHSLSGWAPQILFRKGLAITGLSVALLSVLHWYSSPGLILWSIPDPYAVRVCFPLLNHSHFAALEQLALGPAVWLGMRNEKHSPFYAVAAAVMTGAVFATGSRAGSAIVALELVVLILLNLRLVRSADASRKARRQALLLASLTVLVILGAGWQELAARMAAPPRDELRPLISASAIEMIQARPFAGFGLGTWSTVYPAYARVDPGLFVEHAHDDWLEWAADGGLPFAACMLILAAFALRRSLAEPWCFGITAVFVQAFFEFPLHKPALVALQFAAIGCLTACGRSPATGSG